MPDVFALPGPGQFVSDIVGLLREGRSVLLNVPELFSPDIRLPIEERLSRDAYYSHRLREDEPDPVLSISAAIGCGDDLRGPISVQRLFAHADFRQPQVFIAESNSETALAWDRFLAQFDTAARAWDSFERPRFFVQRKITFGTKRGPVTSPLIAERTWRGVCSELDTLVYVGTSLLRRDLSAAQRRISAATISALSLWDLELADCLLDCDAKVLRDPRPVIREFANAKDWGRDTPLSWELGTLELFEGIEQSHSAWALTQGNEDIVKHRQWAAQASVVLPMLDLNRRRLIDEGIVYLKQALESSPDGTVQPRDLEFSDVNRLLRQVGAPQRLRDRAKLLRDYRNDLAHLEVIAFDELYFSKLWIVR